MFKEIILIIFTLLIYGCATTYQKHSFTGGYDETQLDANVFKVTFNGNGYTSRQRTTDFVLLRSAELTLENGYSYFIIIDSSQYSTNVSHTTPTTTHGSITTIGNTGNFSATTYGGHTYNISKPSSANTIILFKEKPEGFSYNAGFISNSLQNKYGLNKENDI